MADEIKKEAPPIETPKKEEKLEEKESAPEKDDEKILGKFKSPEELVKAYEEVEKKFGEQSEQVRQGREFAQVVQPLLDEIRADPELFKKLDERLRERGQQTTTPKADTKGEEKATGQDEMRTVASDLLLARFEERHGIDKLPANERKDLRQKIGDVIYELTGQALTAVDLRRLGPVLENAYILANKDNLIEKSKLEALASAQEGREAGIPSIPSSPGKVEATLSSEEASVADRLGLAREQYLDGKKSLAKR